MISYSIIDVVQSPHHAVLRETGAIRSAYEHYLPLAVPEVSLYLKARDFSIIQMPMAFINSYLCDLSQQRFMVTNYERGAVKIILVPTHLKLDLAHNLRGRFFDYKNRVR